MHPLRCRPSKSLLLYTTSCNTQSSVPEDGQNNYPKQVGLTGIINKPLLLHLVGCLHYLYQWCTVKQISGNEIYFLIKYIKRVLWRVAKRLSYIEDARCLKVNFRNTYDNLFRVSTDIVLAVRVCLCSWPNQTSPQSCYTGTQFQCTFIWGGWQHTIPLHQGQFYFRQLSSPSRCVRLRDEPHMRCSSLHTNYTSQRDCRYTMTRRSLVRLPLKLRSSRGIQ